MALDEAILAEARRAQDRAAAARREADRARADFIRHIRRLHAAGASLREVGEALGLSHQRVHQIIEAGRPRSDEQKIICCNFCGRAEPEVSKVIAGPGVYICDLCVWKAIVVASGATPEIDDRTAMTTVLPGASDGLKCGFCGKARTKVSAIVVGDGARICNECLDLCEEILTKEADPDSR